MHKRESRNPDGYDDQDLHESEPPTALVVAVIILYVLWFILMLGFVINR